MSKNIKVKVLNVSGNYVSLRYKILNTQSRMKKSDFIKNHANGDFEILNMDSLEDEFLDELKS